MPARSRCLCDETNSGKGDFIREQRKLCSERNLSTFREEYKLKTNGPGVILVLTLFSI